MLLISKVETFYGNIQALRGVDVKVNSGEIVTLIGPNGAGKSTLLMTISGVNKASTGEILFDDQRIENLPPHEIVNLGISQVPEGRRIFSRLSVEDNLRLGASAYEKGKNFDNDVKDVYDLFPVLKDRLNQRGGTLSGGEQQMLAIGRSLMTNPKLLLLDEATEGLAPLVRNEIWRCLNQLKNEGISILVVDKNINDLARIADMHYVIEKGQIVWQGNSTELLNHKDYLGNKLGI